MEVHRWLKTIRVLVPPSPFHPEVESYERQEIFLFSETFRPALGLALLPFKWVPEFFVGVKEAGT